MATRYAIRHRTTGQYLGSRPSLGLGLQHVEAEQDAASYSREAEALLESLVLEDFAPAWAVVPVEVEMFGDPVVGQTGQGSAGRTGTGPQRSLERNDDADRAAPPDVVLGDGSSVPSACGILANETDFSWTQGLMEEKGAVFPPSLVDQARHEGTQAHGPTRAGRSGEAPSAG